MIMVTAFATAVIIKEDVKIKFSEQDTTEIDLERYKVSKELNNIKRNIVSNLEILHLLLFYKRMIY